VKGQKGADVLQEQTSMKGKNLRLEDTHKRKNLRLAVTKSVTSGRKKKNGTHTEIQKGREREREREERLDRPACLTFQLARRFTFVSFISASCQS